jgi:hypothetical protein
LIFFKIYASGSFPQAEPLYHKSFHSLISFSPFSYQVWLILNPDLILGRIEMMQRHLEFDEVLGEKEDI